MKTLKHRYYKYAGGGGMSGGGGGGVDYSAISSLVSTGVDAIDPGNEYGRQSVGATTIKTAAAGAALGTSIVPGIGTIVGAVVGAAGGYIMGKAKKRKEDIAKFSAKLARDQQQVTRSDATVASNPALITGRPGEELYAMGGSLKKRYYDNVQAAGGALKPLSNDSAEVQGPSHEQGGVDLPQYQSEVEGGESLQGDYVFSERLGFAQLHKKLAKSIGKIEQKPATPDRINSLKSLYQQIDQLKQQQEAIRQHYNLQ